MNVELPPQATDDRMNVVIQNEKELSNEREISIQTSGDNALAISEKKELVEIQNEMIPEELLFALTTAHTVSSKEKPKLSPIKDLKTPERLRMAIKKGAPANVWHHKGRRTQFKHLTEHPRSLGKGVGTRDISFLYDVAAQQTPVPPKSNKLDKSAIRLEAQADDLPKVAKLRVPDTVIPEEYHLVKTKAVLGLEYLDEKMTTLLTDRDQALRVFPSLNPTKRFEVIQLLQTLESMLEQSGVADEDLEVKGPTQIHNLLELIKKEQTIYDLVFSEVIRQVSVECLERGQLLSTLRNKYAELLNRVPRQVQSLHAEVMAQRSLDRRLTEELLRFKSSISFLTTELQSVREHDQQVTTDAEVAENELAKALKESEMNANLVDEYHDLYELQRRRLEATVSTLTMERDLWSNAAYSLALKITTINSLNTAKRLHVSEKAWSKLSNHFVVMLSDHDSENLSNVQTHVEKWREIIFHFNQDLEAADKRTTNLLQSVKIGIENWIMKFDDNLISSTGDLRTLKLPPDQFIQGLCDFLKNMEEKLGEDSERFAGGQLLANEEKLNALKKEVDAWTEIAWEVYRRHKSESGEDFPLSTTLKDLNIDLHDLSRQLQIRITGENGVAKGIMSIQAVLDNWVNKLTLLLLNKDNLPETEWWLVYDRLHDYVAVVEETMGFVGSHQQDEERLSGTPHVHIAPEDVMQKVHEWMKNSVNQVEAEDGKLIAQVNSIHTDLVLWMVQMLLHLVPNYDTSHDHPPESSMMTVCTKEELVQKARSISEHMSAFTEYFLQCCSGIVQKSMQEKKDRGDDDADHEYRDFLRVKREAKEWIRTCEFLLNSILPENTALFSKEIVERLRIPEENVQNRNRTGSVSRPSTQEMSSRRANALASIKAAKESSMEIKEEISPVVAQTLEMDVEGEPEAKDSAQLFEEHVSAAKEEAQKMTTAKEAAETMSQYNEKNIQVLGDDENVQTTQLEDAEARALESAVLPQPSSALMQNAYDAIAKMDEIQKQLLRTEIRAQDSEKRVIELEEELNHSSEKIRALEKTVSNLEGRASSQSQTQEKEEKTARPEIAAEASPSTTDTKPVRKSSPADMKRGTSSRGSKPKKQSAPKKK